MQQVKDIDALNCVIEGDCELLDWMISEQKILINGSMYDVIPDHYINEQNDGQGTFWSNLYFIPIAVQGMPVTYMQYLNYREFLPSTPSDNSFWTDNGMYAWTPHQDHWDFDLSVRTDQRVVTMTPQLGGVIRNIMYQPLRNRVYT